MSGRRLGCRCVGDEAEVAVELRPRPTDAACQSDDERAAAHSDALCVLPQTGQHDEPNAQQLMGHEAEQRGRVQGRAGQAVVAADDGQPLLCLQLLLQLRLRQAQLSGGSCGRYQGCGCCAARGRVEEEQRRWPMRRRTTGGRGR